MFHVKHLYAKKRSEKSSAETSAETSAEAWGGAKKPGAAQIDAENAMPRKANEKYARYAAAFAMVYAAALVMMRDAICLLRATCVPLTSTMRSPAASDITVTRAPSTKPRFSK